MDSSKRFESSSERAGLVTAVVEVPDVPARGQGGKRAERCGARAEQAQHDTPVAWASSQPLGRAAHRSAPVLLGDLAGARVLLVHGALQRRLQVAGARLAQVVLAVGGQLPAESEGGVGLGRQQPRRRCPAARAQRARALPPPSVHSHSLVKLLLHRQRALEHVGAGDDAAGGWQRGGAASGGRRGQAARGAVGAGRTPRPLQRPSAAARPPAQLPHPLNRRAEDLARRQPAQTPSLRPPASQPNALTR